MQHSDKLMLLYEKANMERKECYMKFGRILAAVTTGVLAVSSMSFTGLVGYAAPEELMNDTFESGFGAWKGVVAGGENPVSAASVRLHSRNPLHI